MTAARTSEPTGRAVRPGTARLVDSVRAADAAQPDLRMRHGTHDGSWLRCDDLLAGLDGWAGRVARWLDVEYGEAPDRVVTGYLIAWYLTVPAKTAALLFHTARRVPDIGPADLAVRFDGDDPRPAGVTLLSDRFACVAGDPGAHLAEAAAVPDAARLAAVLRGRYAAHAARFLTALGPDVRLGRRTLWASATDVLDGACWRVGQSLGDEGAGAADAALVLPTALPPFTSASTLRRGDDGWTRRRDSCCFHYVLRDGMGTCATCPRLSAR